jgi:polyphosphate kinase 2 (PPK2 family)
MAKDKKEEQKSSQTAKPRMSKQHFNRELEKLQVELCRLQTWVQKAGLRIVVVFEGRDAAGNGGGTVMGVRCPVILTSRADDDRARLASCAVAALYDAWVQGK